MKPFPMPKWTTVVDPTDYDIEGQMDRMVRLANKNREPFTPMDVGKVVGLYLAWKELAGKKGKVQS